MKEKKTKGIWKIKAGLGIIGFKEMFILNRKSKNTKKVKSKLCVVFLP